MIRLLFPTFSASKSYKLHDVSTLRLDMNCVEDRQQQTECQETVFVAFKEGIKISTKTREVLQIQT